MNDSTGLKVINETNGIITIDLFEQGQTGANVPVRSIQAKSVWLVQNIETSDVGPAPSNTYYYTGSFPTDWTRVEADQIFIQSGALNRIINYVGGSTRSVLSGTDPITLQDYADAVKADFATFNSISSDDIIVRPTAEIMASKPTDLVRIKWEVSYRIPTDSLDLINQLRIYV